MMFSSKLKLINLSLLFIDVEDGPREGWYCRGIYKEDGLEYEGVVKSIETTNVGSYAVVEFLGYGNQQPIWFQDILPSKGDEARQKQMGKAIVLFKISLLLRWIGMYKRWLNLLF